MRTTELLRGELQAAPGRGEESALVSRLGRGDPAAVRLVYQQHHEAVRAFARRLLGEEAAAEDLVHEVFLALPQAARRFQGGSSLRTFLLGVAANQARHHRRAAARRRAAMERLAREPVAAEPDPELHAHRDALGRAVRRAIEALPREQRVAFELCEVEERTAGEAAKITGAPEATMRTRLFHARQRLRAELAWLVLALLLIASLAWAAPRALPALFRAAASWISQAAPVAAPPGAEAVSVSVPGSVPVSVPGSVPVPGSVSVPGSVPVSVPGSVPVPVPVPVSVPAPAPAGPDTHALYTEAHRLHFAVRDPSAALRAWEAYLRADPRGRFAPEAHYNRALCLVRLGRLSEARRALEPFARGRAGGYRAAEARALLDALDAAARPSDPPRAP